MMKTNEAIFSKDLKSKKITVLRAFDAPVDQVWDAWTKSAILDQWWAPKPYKTETKTHEFKEGGLWLYCMVGPNNFRHWSVERYKVIEPKKLIINSCAFCDENGEAPTGPAMDYWKKTFTQTGNKTEVNVEINFDRESDMETFLKMGFEGGFTTCLNNLDEYLSAQ
jgi:uncharacterized protein YndB with AHSA1/START domain